MNVKIAADWNDVLKDEFEKDYFTELAGKVREAYLAGTVFPPPKLIFNAFAQCAFADVCVVIIGQDPYHGAGQAMGLSFSVPDGVAIPPSLRNIYKEIEADLGTKPPQSGDLGRWAEQGVLLLNATLTVRQGSAGSHQGWGWETFTNAVIEKLSSEKEHLVFILWGRYAQEKGKNIDTKKHLVLSAAHPSPLSAHNGFFGCRHFSKANAYLNDNRHQPIKW